MRFHPLIMELHEQPEFDDGLTMPSFEVPYVCPATAKPPSEYLKNQGWIDAFKSTVKGVGTLEVTQDMMANADDLAPQLAARLNLHIHKRVALEKQSHFTSKFTRDNIAPMAAALCLVGHTVNNVKRCRLNEGLLALPMHANYGMMAGDLEGLQGCYLYFD